MSESAEFDSEVQPPSTCVRGIQDVATIESKDLLRGDREIHILHEDEVYRLLVTRNNKLILQK